MPLKCGTCRTSHWFRRELPRVCRWTIRWRCWRSQAVRWLNPPPSPSRGGKHSRSCCRSFVRSRRASCQRKYRCLQVPRAWYPCGHRRRRSPRWVWGGRVSCRTALTSCDRFRHVRCRWSIHCWTAVYPQIRSRP